MCLFCEIARREYPAHIVYRDEICTAFLDNDPISEGHVLLIPNGHWLDADDMPEAEFLHLMCVARRLIGALKEAYSPEGYSIMHNGGVFNDVGHFHLHLFPRNSNDGFGWMYPEGESSADNLIAERIAEYMK